MGYILPVTHYTYINYSYRINKTAINPYSIEKPFKVILDEKQLARDPSSGSTLYNDYNHVVGRYFDQVINIKQSLENELTGKGYCVNVRV